MPGYTFRHGSDNIIRIEHIVACQHLKISIYQIIVAISPEIILFQYIFMNKPIKRS